MRSTSGGFTLSSGELKSFQASVSTEQLARLLNAQALGQPRTPQDTGASSGELRVGPGSTLMVSSNASAVWPRHPDSLERGGLHLGAALGPGGRPACLSLPWPVSILWRLRGY